MTAEAAAIADPAPLIDLDGSAAEAGDNAETVRFPTEEDRPCWRVYDDWGKLEKGRKVRPGVWRHAMSEAKKDTPSVPVDTWVCGPLHIEAQTFDGAVPREEALRLLSYPLAEASLTATVLGPDGVQTIEMPDRKAIVRTDTGVAFGVFKQGYKIWRILLCTN